MPTTATSTAPESQNVPTPSELLSLTNLILEEPTPPPFTNILNEFLDLCSQEWILNFLFTQDPIHLTHLTSSTFTSSSVTSYLTTTRVEPPSWQPDPASLEGESHHEHCVFVLVPVFTLGDITIGIGVFDGLVNVGTPWLPKAFTAANMMRSNFRFLRDARRRSFLVLTDAPDDDSVMVYYARNETLTRCHSFQAGFRRAQFLDLVKKGDANFRIDTLLPACQFIINEVQHRICPLCNAPLKTPCTCQFPIPPAAHPFDTSHFFASFMEDFGVYQGVASKLIRDESGLNRHIQLGVRVACQGFVDFDHALLTRLTEWSVSSYLNTATHDPRHSNLSRQNSSPLSAGVYRDTASQQVRRTGLFEDDQADLQSWFQDTVDLLFASEAGQDAGGLAIRNSGLLQESTRAAKRLRPGVTSSSAASTAPSGSRGASSETGTVPEIPALDFEVGNDALWWDERISGDSDNGQARADVSRTTLGNTGVSDNLLAVQEIPHLSVEAAVAPANVSGLPQIGLLPSEAPVVSRAPVTTAATILPMPTAGAEAGRDAKELAKRMKAEERRRRNRLAAQRSNMKRKEVCDAIRVQLKSLREKIEVLKTKEGALKEENLNMRGALEEDR